MRPALVLVHGFLGSSNNWLTTVSKIKQNSGFSGVNCYCPDLRWHSGDPSRFSVFEGEDFNTESVAKYLASQLSLYPERELVLLGHSFGLRPLLKIVAQGLLPTKKIIGIIAEDSSPELSAHGVSLLEKILEGTPVPFVSRESARSFFDTNFGSGSALSKFLLSNIRQDESGTKHTWKFAHESLCRLLQSAKAESLQREWTSIAEPIHMIVGKNSQHLTPEIAQAWQKLRTDRGLSCELVYVEGAGHWVHSDQPDLFVEALSNLFTWLT